MTTSNQKQPETTDLVVHPVPTNLEALWQRTQDAAGERFPSFGGGPVGVYSNMLHGVPFIFLSAPLFRTKEGKFGQQEIAQAYIASFDDAWKLTDKQLVTFTGAYLLNQLRGATPRELIGSYIFTVWPHDTLKRVDGRAPLMLKKYEAGDMPPETTDVWGGGQQTNHTAVSARIAEIESAGAVPPPWETQATGPSGVAQRGKK